MPAPLKVNVESYKISGPEMEDVTFYLRGLTVSEMTALQYSTKDSTYLRATDFYRIGRLCLIGWDGIERWMNGELYEIHCSDSNIEKYIQTEHIAEMGKHVFFKMSYLSDSEELKYKAYVNFVFFMNDEKKGAQNRDNFTCENCARRGLIFERPCGRKDKEKLIEQYHGKKDVAKKKKSNVEAAREKFGIKNKVFKTGKELSVEEQERKRLEREEKAKSIVINGIRLPECPVTFLDPHIRSLSDALWDCAKNGKSYSSGGVEDQQNKIYQAEKVVIGEASKLEAAEIKKQSK